MRADYATLIRGGTLVLPDGPDRVRAEPGDLLIEGTRIGALGAIESPPRGARIIYASGCAVLPGFVQTHVHLCHTLMRGLAGQLPRLDWLRERIWPLEAAHTSQSMRASARLGVAELLLGGTTAIQTMESVHHTDAVLEVLVEAGMHAVTGKCLMDDVETCPPALVQATDTALREAIDLAEQWDRSGQGRVRVCLAPRSAASCTPACLREVGELARAGLWRVHTHAPASRDAATLARGRHDDHGVRLLDELGLTGEHVGLAGCVQLDDEDVEILRRTGTHLLHCPGSDCNLGAGTAPVPQLLARGVRVSLGTDGAASNEALDMFREMRFASLLHRAVHGPTVLPAPRVLDMATRGGAAALGREGELGVLAPGAVANVVLVSLDSMHATPAPDPLAALVHCAHSSDIRAVWLAGEQVVSEGRLCVWDEEEIRRDARREARALAARAGLA